MKLMSGLKIIGMILLTLIVGLVSYEAYHAYMMEHEYYLTMMSNAKSWGLILTLIIVSMPVLWTVLWKKKFRLSYLGGSLLIMMLLGSYAHVLTKGGLTNTTGVMIFLFNILILLAIILTLLGGLYVLGQYIYKRFIKRFLPSSHSWLDIILSFGLGLGGFLLINYLLIMLQVFYPLVVWLEFLALAYAIFYFRQSFSLLEQSLQDSITALKQAPLSYQIAIATLLVITLIYIVFSFNLSWIPYSTAWDANHAYMYYPKLWSLHHGLYFSGGPTPSPYIWMSYIAVGFSLFQPFGTTGLIAPDTLAVVLNNISGWIALLFGLGASYAIIDYFKLRGIIRTDTQVRTAFGLSWGYFLLRLMSGMGAFLVFVDNKTDLGVMALTMLALVSGFIFIKALWQQQEENNSTSHFKFSRKLQDNIPALLSGFFFALAIMSKPTAFQDAALFLIFIVGLFVGILGSIGLFLLLLAVLGKAQTMSMVFYISKKFATKLGIAGILASFGEVFLSWKKKLTPILFSLLYRGGSILVLLLVFKGSYLIIRQSITHTFTPSNFAKGLLLGMAHDEGGMMNTNSHSTTDVKNYISTNPLHSQYITYNSQFKTYLLADTGDGLPNLSGAQDQSELLIIKPAMCTLDSVGLTQDGLFDNLQDIEGGGLTEDLLRYIGYGQREFTAPSEWSVEEKKFYGQVKLGYTLLKRLTPGDGCYGSNAIAKTLCQTPELGESRQGIETLLQNTKSGSNQYLFLESILTKYQQLELETDESRQSSYMRALQQDISNYVESNSIHISHSDEGHKIIALPYAYLTPLNVVFNRSLQNRSSYYTDIGFIWIIGYILLIAGLIYSIVHRQRDHIALQVSAIVGWLLWRFLASGIIWYAVGIIAWTTFANVIFLGQLFHNDKTHINYRISRILLGILILIAIIQTLFNLTRIASQGGSGPFAWYKGHVGLQTSFLFDNQGGFGQQTVTNYQYNAQTVFDAQFGHYNTFLNYVKDRKDEDGILIAGTYLQYFLTNSSHLTSDGLLTNLRQRGSDGNLCAMDLRLADKHIKYLVIDPNIGSVVMGEGNASLFDRFIAKINTQDNSILEDGALTLLSKLVNNGYLRLISTNNMGAKYAYTLSDGELEQAIATLDGATHDALLKDFQDDSTLFRVRLAVPRFFQKEANNYFLLIGAIFQERLLTSQGLEDLADILGQQVNLDKLVQSIVLIDAHDPNKKLIGLNHELSDDDRTVLGYYLTIRQYIETGNTDAAQDIVSNLLQTSITNSSQLITFERTN